MAGLMDQARSHLREWIESAKPGEHVASVASLSAAAGDLGTSATVKVLKEAIDDGWLYSTRGPDGGYWRTEKPAHLGLASRIDELERQLQGALGSVQAIRAALAA